MTKRGCPFCPTRGPTDYERRLAELPTDNRRPRAAPSAVWRPEQALRRSWPPPPGRRAMSELRRVGLNLLYLVPGETGGGEVYARNLAPKLAEERPTWSWSRSSTGRPRTSSSAESGSSPLTSAGAAGPGASSPSSAGFPGSSGSIELRLCTASARRRPRARAPSASSPSSTSYTPGTRRPTRVSDAPGCASWCRARRAAPTGSSRSRRRPPRISPTCWECRGGAIDVAHLGGRPLGLRPRSPSFASGSTWAKAR